PSPTTKISTLSLHDALPIYSLPPVEYAKVIYSIQNEMIAKPTDYFVRRTGDLYFDVDLVTKYQDGVVALMKDTIGWSDETRNQIDRKSTRLNSSHVSISYAV